MESSVKFKVCAAIPAAEVRLYLRRKSLLRYLLHFRRWRYLLHFRFQQYYCQHFLPLLPQIHSYSLHHSHYLHLPLYYRLFLLFPHFQLHRSCSLTDTSGYTVCICPIFRST